MRTLSLIVLTTALCGSGSWAKDPGTEQLQEDTHTAFAVDLYQQARVAEGNLFFSPYSVSSALGMLYGGADGATAQQLRDALHATELKDRLPGAYGRLRAHLESVERRGHVELSIANSLWPQKSHPFKNSYCKLARECYSAGITPVDFIGNSVEARQSINDWVAANTKDRIRDLLPPGCLNPLTRMVLANAVYFKGRWATQFKENQTRQELFHGATRTSEIPMMHGQAKFGYYANDALQILELPYEGNQLSMFVLLPRDKKGLSRLEDTLSVENLNRWLDCVRTTEVQAHVPKFKLDRSLNLGQCLKRLGVTDAFEPGKADFSAMDGTRDLFLSDAFHKAFIDVNEEGTETAAATGLGLWLRSARPPQKPPLFKADHPFIFVIRDRIQQSVMFMGRFVDDQ